MSLKSEAQNPTATPVDSTSVPVATVTTSAATPGQPVSPNSQSQPADTATSPPPVSSSAVSFEDFDLDDVEVVESKVFA